ncbi:MAG: DUF6268 family outer membrane beta-barrel protein, partial [Myxococcota bacterium]
MMRTVYVWWWMIGAVLATLGGSSSVQAQATPGPIMLDYRIYPNANARLEPDFGPGRSAGKVQVHDYRAIVGFPFVFNDKKTILLPSIDYGLLDLRGDGTLDPGVEKLHSAMVHMVLVQRLSESWTGLFRLGGGLASDLEGDITQEEFVLTAMAIASYAFTEDLRVGAGIIYDRRTGDVRPLPLINVQLYLNERFRIGGVIPVLVQAAYRVTPHLTLGLQGSFQGNRYHLDEERYGVDNAEVAYSIIEAGPTAIVHLGKALHIQLVSGYTIRRRFEVFLNDESQGNAELDNAFVL